MTVDEPYGARGEEVWVTANQLRHRILRYGGAGPELFLLPGITSPALTMDFLAVELGTRFRVHVPDIRGRGGTRAPAGAGFRLRDYAADASGVIHALGLRRPVLLGHSMGARIAAATAPLIEHGPLVLVDPPLSGPGRPYPTSLRAFQDQLDEARTGTTAEAVARWYPNWPFRERAIRAQELATCDPLAVQQTHHGFETEDFAPYWERLNAPLTLIRGGDSPVVTADDLPWLVSRNPAAAVAEVPHAGHMVPWDNLPGFLTSFREAVPVDTDGWDEAARPDVRNAGEVPGSPGVPGPEERGAPADPYRTHRRSKP